MGTKKEFCSWVDGIMKDFDLEVKAFCFNIYEDTLDGEYSVELTAFDEYDEYDDSWNCGGAEVYASRNDENEFAYHDNNGCENCLQVIGEYIAEYLENGKYSKNLKQADAVTYGFVDGDLEIAYEK